LDAWIRWRFGERICVVCGAPPVESIEFPSPFFYELGWAGDGPTWWVPVCGRLLHRMSALWPVRTQIALADEHRATMEGQPPRTYQATLWG
jgi:hypothetical protein